MRRPHLHIVVASGVALISLLGSTPAALGQPSTTTTTPPPDPAVASPAPPDTASTTTVTTSPGSTSTVPAPASERPIALGALSAQVTEEGSVRVAVRVADGVDPSDAVSTALSGTDHEVGSESKDVVGVEVDAEGLARLASAPGVEQIVEDIVMRPTSSGSVDPGLYIAPIRADVVHSEVDARGEGRRIAVLDSGVDLMHATFQDPELDVVEACVVTHGPEQCGDVVGPGTAAPCSASSAGCEHGTHVTGIAVGRGSASDPKVPRGVAPAADLVAIRVLSPNDDGLVEARSSDVLAALDRVLELDAIAPIDAVNMSLGGFAFPGQGTCDTADDGLMRAKFAELRAANVAPIVASGNNGGPGGQGALGLSYPACVTGAIPVSGSNTSTRALWSGANRNSAVVVAAPAVDLIGAIPSGSPGDPTKTGTSLAAPQVAAAVALMRQNEPNVSISAITSRLKATGRSLSGTSIRQLDVAAAIGGYWALDSFGLARPAGPLASMPPSGGGGIRPTDERVVAGAPHPDGGGFWVVTERGRVISYGGAGYFGDRRGAHLNQPIVAMAATPSGNGYWLLAADGGIFTFGDAPFRGSTGDMALNAPITDMAAAPSGQGYWLTAKDGGVFTFGDARFYGSTGGMTLNQPVVSIAAHPTAGYWLVALDGGVFTFGDAAYHGSLPGSGVWTNQGARIRATVNGRGYYITTRTGGVYPYGNASPIQPRGLTPGEKLVDIMLPPIN